MVDNINKYKLLLKKRNSILIGFLLTCLIQVVYAETSKAQKYNFPYPKELINLAESLGMEPIGGEKYWNSIITYGGQGLPYIFDFITKVPAGKDKAPKNVLFWCQKDKKKYLIYAEENSHANYEVKRIIRNAEMVGHDYNIEGSYGLVVYKDILGIDKDLSNFYYLDNPQEHGPKGVYPISSNGCLPIIMYQESSIAVLYLYKNRWLQYVEIDE